MLSPIGRYGKFNSNFNSLENLDQEHQVLFEQKAAKPQGSQEALAYGCVNKIENHPSVVDSQETETLETRESVKENLVPNKEELYRWDNGLGEVYPFWVGAGSNTKLKPKKNHLILKKPKAKKPRNLALATMFFFTLDETHQLAEAMYVIASITDIVDLKFSVEKMSIMGKSTTNPTCIISIQLWPRFFKKYICHQHRYSWIYVHRIFPLMSDLQLAGFSSLTFSFTVPNYANLTFEGSGRYRKAYFELHPTNDSKDIGEFDSSTFVTMKSQEFINMTTRFHRFRFVLVSLRSSQVRFSHGRIETILTHESGRCVIGGVGAKSEVRFVITLDPMRAFCNLARQTERVWLFKYYNSPKGVISAPLGLHARFLAYFPQRKI